jgi:selenide,water dikinase
LAGIIAKLPKIDSPNLLVGMETLDDAGVYRLTDDMAVVQSVDFFYPIVNNARKFGRIVAANSLSDIWAMGGNAITAMNILAYPAGKIPHEIIEELLIGGSEKLQEANVILVGGHTMEQEEFFFGMSVSGLIHPDSILTNSRARPGDRLILTKPLGTGVLCNAYQQDCLTEMQYSAFTSSMERLNLYAANLLRKFDISAMTDVTGFGLLGHALPIARNANVLLQIQSDKVPVFDGIFQLMERFYAKEVCKTKQYVMDYTHFEDGITDNMTALLCEAQTSGGLLAAIHPDQAEEAVQAITEAGDIKTSIVGTILERPESQKESLFLHIT